MEQQNNHELRGVQDTAGLSLVIDICMNGQRLKAVLDTAAQATVLNAELASKMQLDLQEDLVLKCAGKGTQITGRIAKNTNIKLGGKCYKWDVVVAPIGDDLLLGLDFLAAHSSTIDISRNLITLEGEEIPASLRRTANGSKFKVSRVTVGKRTIIPPHSAKLTPTRLSSPADTDFVIEKYDDCQGLLMAATVVKGCDPNPTVCFINLTDKYVTLKPGKWLGNATEVEEPHDLASDVLAAKPTVRQVVSQSPEKTLPQYEANLPEHVKPMCNAATVGLTPVQSLEVAKLLSKVADVLLLPATIVMDNSRRVVIQTFCQQ